MKKARLTSKGVKARNRCFVKYKTSCLNFNCIGNFGLNHFLIKYESCDKAFGQLLPAELLHYVTLRLYLVVFTAFQSKVTYLGTIIS
jgi:hypothetical protein